MTTCVSTLVGDSEVMGRVYGGCVVIFSNSESWADLILLDMLNSHIIEVMDWFYPYHVILDCYVKIVTLAYLDSCGMVL